MTKINAYKSLKTVLSTVIFVLMTVNLSAGQQPAERLTGEQITGRVSPSVAVVVAGDSLNNISKVGCGVFVREDGVLLTAYNLVKDAREVQVRLKGGDVYDRVELLGVDERRNVAALKIPASGIRTLPIVNLDEVREGMEVYAFSHPKGLTWTFSSGVLSAIRLADEVSGAGQGYRLIQFSAPVSGESSGGVLVDAYGRAVGLIVSQLLQGQNLYFAVPISTVKGLANMTPVAKYNSGNALSLSPLNTPRAQIKPVLSRDPKELLLNSKTIHVNSRTTFFKEHQLINEFSKRSFFKEREWLFLDGGWNTREKADLIIELDHQIFTYTFTFTITHRETSIVLAAGKVIILDGAAGAPKMVDRMIEKLSAVIAPKPNVAKDKKTGTD